MPPVEVEPAKKKDRSRFCEARGLRLTPIVVKGTHYYDQVHKPIAPRATYEFGDTVDSILAHAHYLLVRDWDDPEGVKLNDLQVQTYMAACALGFSGHLGEWTDNIYLGKLGQGTVDHTPKRVKLRAEQ